MPTSRRDRFDQDRQKQKGQSNMELPTKKKFVIPCYWEFYGNVEVEAETVEEAIIIVEDDPLPDGSYVTDSFRVDHEVIESYNSEED